MPTRRPKLEPGHATVPSKAWDRYKHARAMSEQWAEVMKDARAEIEEALGEDEFAELEDGTVVVEWKHYKENRFNAAKHKDAHPECHAEFTELRPARRFVPKP